MNSSGLCVPAEMAELAFLYHARSTRSLFEATSATDRVVGTPSACIASFDLKNMGVCV